MGSCIQLAQPIGFAATWSYLQWKVRRSWRDPEYLLPALDLLEAERSTHLRIDGEYAQLRREQKAAGYRFPRRDEVTARNPRRWHGDEQMGALFALQEFRRRRRPGPPNVSRVLALVERHLGSPAPTVEDLDELQASLAWARRQVYRAGGEAGASEAHFLLGQLHLVIKGATPIGTQWNFLEG
jgi:hypothetical protein